MIPKKITSKKESQALTWLSFFPAPGGLPLNLS
jgi:hypothetical protein